jgi:hypothetical protein
MLKTALWLAAFGTIAGIGYLLRHMSQRAAERKAAAEHRAASFLAEAMKFNTAQKAAAPAPQERLLFDAAAKAGDAGEPALAIQLYARLLSRFPQTALAGQARAAVDAQKKKLSTATAPGPAAPG